MLLHLLGLAKSARWWEETGSLPVSRDSLTMQAAWLGLVSPTPPTPVPWGSCPLCTLSRCLLQVFNTIRKTKTSCQPTSTPQIAQCSRNKQHKIKLLNFMQWLVYWGLGDGRVENQCCKQNLNLQRKMQEIWTQRIGKHKRKLYITIWCVQKVGG